MNEYSLKCRICLDTEEHNTMFALFDDNQLIKKELDYNKREKDMELYEKVENCCRVRIRYSSELPKKICSKCHRMVHYWVQFRKMCLTTQVYLESICKATQQQQDAYIDDEIDKDYVNELYKNFDILYQDFNYKTYSDFSDEESSIEHTSNRESRLTESPIKYPTIDEKGHNQSTSEIGIKKKEAKSEIGSERRKKLSKTMQKQYDTLQRNIRIRTPSPTSYMCTICGNVYNKKSSFLYHMSRHNNLRPHECEICGKKFRQVCELKNHIRRHTGEKPFKCRYCERRFIDRSEKHRHERVHTNTRPYVCAICGKSFMYSAILKNHSKLHSGEKSFNCLVCEKSFTLQHHLKAHLQTLVHKQKEQQYLSAGFDVVYE